MKINKRGIDLIKNFEGLSLKAYLCPGNKWTIGWGSIRINNRSVRSGDIITLEEAEKLLNNEINIFSGGVTKLLRVRLNDNQFSALVSFAFNLGLGNLRNSTLLRLINNNPNDINIRNEWMRWTRANGQVLSGLVRRRTAEVNLYFTK